MREARRLSAFELRRKCVHVLLGIALSLLIFFGLITPDTLFAILILGFLISLLEKKKRLPFLSPILDLLERQEARRRLPGEPLLFFLLGVYLLLRFFPHDKDIVLASLMVLTFGDPVAHLFGVRFGKVQHPFSDKKFVEGMLAGMVAGFLPALLFVPPLEAGIAAVCAMLIEALEVRWKWMRVDDNAIIPLVAAASIYALRTAL